LPPPDGAVKRRGIGTGARWTRVSSPASPPVEGRPGRTPARPRRAPGDKSISHRALILGGLAEGRTTVDGLLEGADVLATAAAMRAFGADVEREADGRWTVQGRASCASLRA
jgi:3-phosphoshikimate 1-carboxyvinyltransferase